MNKETLQLYNEYIAHSYARNSLEISSGSGALCSDENGRPLIDLSSGIGVNSLGFVNKFWVEAVKGQLDTLAHTSNLYYTRPQAELAKRLCERTGMKRVFYANSGAEANEGMIKTARKYSSDKYSHDRCEIITLVNSFHGRTIATLAATGQDFFHNNFGPFPGGFVYSEANNPEDLKQKLTDKTCAIMIECIQGEGGVIPLDDEYISAVASLCKEKDILLLVDEVQTGVGRTGRFLCSEYWGLNPDVVSLAKGLGGGLPIGAVLFGEKTKDTLGPGDHATTFGGNPVICTGALAVMDAIDDVFLQNVVDKGAYLTEKILALPGVTGVTGKGLMLGASLEDGLVSGEIVANCIELGLVLLTAKAKLRFLPPLTITTEEIDKGVAILEQVLKKKKASEGDNA